MFPHPDLALEQARLQLTERRREAELARLARQARLHSDRAGSSPLQMGPHQIGQKRNWRAESRLLSFLRAIYPLGTIEYLASRRLGRASCPDCEPS